MKAMASLEIIVFHKTWYDQKPELKCNGSSDSHRHIYVIYNGFMEGDVGYSHPAYNIDYNVTVIVY